MDAWVDLVAFVNFFNEVRCSPYLRTLRHIKTPRRRNQSRFPRSVPNVDLILKLIISRRTKVNMNRYLFTVVKDTIPFFLQCLNRVDSSYLIALTEPAFTAFISVT